MFRTWGLGFRGLRVQGFRGLGLDLPREPQGPK